MAIRQFKCLSRRASSARAMLGRQRNAIAALAMVTLGLLAALSPAIAASMPREPAAPPTSSAGLLTETTSLKSNDGLREGGQPLQDSHTISGSFASLNPGGMVVITAGATRSKFQFAIPTEMISQIASQAGELRQLNCEAVPVQLMNRDELKEMLLQDFEEESEQMDITQELLVFLDLLEEGQDLGDILVDAYTQDILGFYDPEQDELYLVSETGELGPLDKMTLAHEYTHAIQDQHFDLTSLGSQDDDSEASAATDALVEGDATVVMALYYWSCLSSEEQEAIGEMDAEPGMELDEDVPEVIQKTMMFPYEYGMTFVIAIIQKGRWEAVNQAYSDPPKSTEQIMHPEKYVQDRDDPVVVTLPNMATALGHEWSELDSDVFGEFSLKLYLQAFLNPSEAERAAAGWGGDRYSFLEDSAERKAFVLKSEWDTEDDARVFYEACTDRAREKGGSGALGKARGDKASAQWESEGLNYRFALEEGSVYLVIAPDAKTADKAVAAASGADKSSNVWIYLGIGLACFAGVVAFAVLLLWRRGRTRLAAESAVSQSGRNL